MTIADATLDLSVVDVAGPSGYSSIFDSPINNTNKAAASITISGAEVGSTYNYSITSTGGGAAVTGTGTISTATENITGLDLSGLGDGTLTVSVTLTDTLGNVGGVVTGTTTKDIVGPAVTSVVKADADGLYEPN
ncbi:MAG: hypothetical protein LRY36_01290 [Alphaproteobacteria bacterium]|nr:hypothetical protein [Alphaproteobacteria bacterium]MCD8566551.1 hypothetical protein [Alphaproteobacteria bacterium]